MKLTLTALLLLLISLPARPDSEKGNNAASGFEISVGNLSPYGCTVTYRPVHYDGNYFFLVMNRSAMEEYLRKDGLDGLIASDREWIQALAEKSGQEFSSYLRKTRELYASRGGETVMDYTSLAPETEYYAYCYGMDSTGNALTRVFLHPFSTTSIQALEMKFTVRAENIDGSSADFFVIPEHTGQYYYWTYVSEAELSQSGAQAIQEETVRELRNYADLQGTPLSEQLFNGVSSERLNDLFPDTRYYAVIWGMDRKGNPTSLPKTVEFLTTDVLPVTDPCTFRIACTRSEAMDLVLDIQPSDPLTRYYVAAIHEDKCDGYTPEQMAARILRMESRRLAGNFYGTGQTWENADFLLLGNRTVRAREDLFWTFEPDERYCIYVFGVNTHGVRTTAVSCITQKTAPAEKSGMTFSVKPATVPGLPGNAVLTIIPDNNDEYFAAAATGRRYLERFRKADGQLDTASLLDSLRSDSDGRFPYLLRKGPVTLQFPYCPKEDNILVICGYAGGNTTPFYEFPIPRPTSGGNAADKTGNGFRFGKIYRPLH